MEGYWFRSSRFQVIPGEDMDVHPGIYGRQLAYWLRDGLAARGYADAEVIPEPWGWCVVCRHRPPLLWVGCGSVVEDEHLGLPPPPRTEDPVWHCFVAARCGWLARLFGGAASAEQARRRLDEQVGALLREDPQITLVDEP